MTRRDGPVSVTLERGSANNAGDGASGMPEIAEIRHRFRGALVPSLAVLVLLLGACGGGGVRRPQSPALGSITATPKPTVQGSGKAPRGVGQVPVPSPSPVVGGAPGSQQVAIGNTMLVVNSVTTPSGGLDPNRRSVGLSLTVKDLGDQPIMNVASSFQLMGSDGDTFGSTNSSDGFFGSVAPHSVRTGDVEFTIPAAASSGGLRLLYRPSVSTGAVMFTLGM